MRAGAIPTACAVSPHHVVAADASTAGATKAVGTATVPPGSLVAPTPSTLTTGSAGGPPTVVAPISVSRIRIPEGDAAGKKSGPGAGSGGGGGGG